MNMEARGEEASMLNRKCVVVWWKDLSSQKFLDLIQRGAGALLILLPRTNASVDEDTLNVSSCTLFSHVATPPLCGASLDILLGAE